MYIDILFSIKDLNNYLIISFIIIVSFVIYNVNSNNLLLFCRQNYELAIKLQSSVNISNELKLASEIIHNM